MSYNHPYNNYPYQPEAQSGSSQPYDVVSWIEALASQEHGWDPAIYSDPVVSTQYQQTYQPISYTPQIHPQHIEQTRQTQSAQPARFLSHPYASPMVRSNSYPPVFLQSSSASSYDHIVSPTNFGYYSSPEAVIDEEFSSVGSSSPPPTDPESPGSSIARAKSKIALAPTQPLTVDGKPRERVFVACDRCRLRKLRCDGGKPSCINCERAPELGVQCRYDPLPKRRGQDKAPRTRSAVGQRKPRRPAVRKADLAAAAAAAPRTP